MNRSSLLFVPFLLIGAHAQGNGYTDAMFSGALEDRGTNRVYVLVTLKEKDPSLTRIVCIEAPFLIGAIQSEHGLWPVGEDLQKSLKIARTQPGRVFSFSNARARRNVMPRYDTQVLDEVRRYLKTKTNSELLKEVQSKDSVIHKIYQTKSDIMVFGAYQDAVAHVLLERGIQVHKAEGTDLLSLGP